MPDSAGRRTDESRRTQDHGAPDGCAHRRSLGAHRGVCAAADLSAAGQRGELQGAGDQHHRLQLYRHRRPRRHRGQRRTPHRGKHHQLQCGTEQAADGRRRPRHHAPEGRRPAGSPRRELERLAPHRGAGCGGALQLHRTGRQHQRPEGPCGHEGLAGLAAVRHRRRRDGEAGGGLQAGKLLTPLAESAGRHPL